LDVHTYKECGGVITIITIIPFSQCFHYKQNTTKSRLI